MARPLRIEYDGALYHVTARRNDRKAIFKNDDDRVLFLDTLQRVNIRYNWLCHAYCLMDNQYHLVIETPDGNLSLGMRQLNGIYTQTFNRRHDKIGWSLFTFQPGPVADWSVSYDFDDDGFLSTRRHTPAETASRLEIISKVILWHADLKSRGVPGRKVGFTCLRLSRTFRLPVTRNSF